MDLNIGMRYHFSVISIQNGIPTIGINYQPKVKRELQKFNLDQFVVEMSEITSANLIDKTQIARKNHALISSEIHKQTQSLFKSSTKEVFHEVFRNL